MQTPNQQSIDCPDCGSKIIFDPHALVLGKRFACPQCPTVSIGLMQEDRETVRDALEKFENLKKDIGNKH